MRALAHVRVPVDSFADAAQVTELIAQHDLRDRTSALIPAVGPAQAMERGIRGLHIAWSPDLGYARPQLEGLQAPEATLRSLEANGALVTQLDTVLEEDPVRLWGAEFFAGVGFKLKGVRRALPETLDLGEVHLLRGALYGQSVEDHMGAVFERFAVRGGLAKTHQPYDVLTAPILPIASIGAGRNISAGSKDRSIVSGVSYTHLFNLTGNPAAPSPCRFHRKERRSEYRLLQRHAVRRMS